MEQGMTSRNRAVTLKRVVLIIAGINAGLLLSALAMSLIVSGGIDGGVGYVVGIVYTVLAIMIISRHPRHTVGWLFLTVGFFSAMTVFVFGFEAVTDNKSLQRIIPLMEWIGFWSWVPVFFIPDQPGFAVLPGRPVAVTALVAGDGGDGDRHPGNCRPPCNSRPCRKRDSMLLLRRIL